jgi:hypothetical protein
MSERWRSIPDWPNHEVSGLGRFRKKACVDGRGRLTSAHILKVHVYRNGRKSLYRRAFVWLYDVRRKKNATVARLVLLAFRGPPPSRSQNKARHLNDDVTNNRLSNLAWGSQGDNIADMDRNGHRAKGEKFIPRS